jgi:hypothetical protein
MLTVEQGAALSTRALASGVPRLTPLHDPLDKRHSDLSFSVDTGGRPRFRVLIARERALFAPDQAGARNASNFLRQPERRAPELRRASLFLPGSAQRAPRR